MKKLIALSLFVMLLAPAFSQSCYWVFLTDKKGTTFDPYTYFDAKAIERYQQNNADLYDISNYPLNNGYVEKVNAIATEEVGQSRWMNALAVSATPEQICRIEKLPFVNRVQRIGGDMQLAEYSEYSENSEYSRNSENSEPPILTDQLVRMQGEMFRAKGIDGKGMRIAVLDGGFPRVNTHAAFKHLRDNHRILDTWNFPNKKADVYGWNSHGLSTLSCITGIAGNEQLGLATGAEFLLYRTEVELEPFKEEVWWMQAVERADKHGANIISSSLGYGKERYWTKDMDGTSYVAKAGNLAAKKGILVCCSAGNEADTRQWKTIVTPSDADSVLCIGGIESSLKHYRHISFSSFGPSADGRLKPNVSAFGHAKAATKASDEALSWVYGTSFSCPLVAGFAACAWQTMPGKTAMEMFQLIQQSADRHPYYDYALGYGVPQASFFVGESKRYDPTFVIRETKDSVEVHLLKPAKLATIFYNKQQPDGTLVKYASCELENATPQDCLRFYKGSLDSCRLNVSYNGYTNYYRLSDKDWQRMRLERAEFVADAYSTDEDFSKTTELNRDASDLVPSLWGSNAKRSGSFYVQYGNLPATGQLRFWSPSFHMGYRLMRAFGKAYHLGVGLEWNTSHINYHNDQFNTIDRVIGLDAADKYKVKRLEQNQFALELFQRVRFVPGGMAGNGIYWDLGAFVGWNFSNNYLTKQTDVNPGEYNGYSQVKTTYKLVSPTDDYRFVIGATTRIVYDYVGVYARFSLPTQYSKCGCTATIPPLEIGVQLEF